MFSGGFLLIRVSLELVTTYKEWTQPLNSVRGRFLGARVSLQGLYGRVSLHGVSERPSTCVCSLQENCCMLIAVLIDRSVL